MVSPLYPVKSARVILERGAWWAHTVRVIAWRVGVVWVRAVNVVILRTIHKYGYF